ncbi:MAG: FtsW/RodA/SpoVE family cell cycle protein [Lachnospiraceae bacterium]|nr:FtsW/RodA/SpoVE family cell cycle protein [Lachnospiraceae bacterium]
MTKSQVPQKRNGRERRKRPDPCLVLVLSFLLLFGLIILYSSTGYVDAKEHPGNPYYTITRQSVFLLLALAVMVAVTRIDYHRLVGLAWILYPVSVLLGILVLFFGREVNGQKRWFAVGPISFQPAEFAKLTLILTLTSFFHRHYQESSRLSLIGRAVLLTLPVFLPVVDANLSSGLIIAGIAFFLTFTASERKPLFFLLVAAVLVFCVAAYQSGLLASVLDEYQMNRVYAWLDPEQFPLSNGFQVLQGLYAIGAGGLFGVGLGNSLQKLGYLPEAQNDMIFSIICEELGLTGAVFLMILFVILMWRFLVIAVHAADDEGMFLTAGVMIHIGIQVLLNISVVTNTIPNTGVSLPFISYGGSSLLFLLTEIGIVFRVSTEPNAIN